MVEGDTAAVMRCGGVALVGQPVGELALVRVEHDFASKWVDVAQHVGRELLLIAALASRLRVEAKALRDGNRVTACRT